MRRTIQKIYTSLLLCMVLMFNVASFTVQAAGIDSSTMSQIVSRIGTQTNKSYSKAKVMCTAFSMAYCRAYLYNDYREATAYWGAGGAQWSAGGGTKRTYSSNAQVLAALKTSIAQGRPCVVRVNSSSGGHSIVAFSYSGNGNSNSNFTVVDPWNGKIKSLGNYTIHSSEKYVVTFGVSATNKVSNTSSSSAAKNTDLSFLFDYEYYASRYPDLMAAFGLNKSKLYAHWNSYGKREGRSPSILYEPSYYRDENPDLKAAFGSDYVALYNHLVTYGVNEFRATSPVYSGTYYKNKYSDLRSAFSNNSVEYMRHFVTYGVREQRQASAEFNVAAYKSRYADLRNAFGNNTKSYFTHYMTYGRSERRNAK